MTYQLCIDVPYPLRVQIGRLGELVLPRCKCVYTGSAKRNLESRVARHLRQEKKLRWHIDYLLAQPNVSVEQVLRFSEPECDINQQVEGSVVLAGFGSSDCKNGCGSHLKLLRGTNVG